MLSQLLLKKESIWFHKVSSYASTTQAMFCSLYPNLNSFWINGFIEDKSSQSTRPKNYHRLLLSSF